MLKRLSLELLLVELVLRHGAAVIDTQDGAKRHRGATELVSLCDVPFVLTPEAKAAIFKIEAMVEMNIQVQSWSINVRLPAPRSALLSCVDKHRALLCCSKEQHFGRSKNAKPLLSFQVRRSDCL